MHHQSIIDRRSTSGRVNRGAFTLIEVLVVVAIIALLIAILLPSLNRARGQAKMVACQSNLRQLSVAFVTYSVESKGRLPGNQKDYMADWLGGSNVNLASSPPKEGFFPRDGTVFKYMGRSAEAYICPEDRAKDRQKAPSGMNTNGEWIPGNNYSSYSANLMLSGAKVEMLSGAHYPQEPLDASAKYNRPDHTTSMSPFEGVPMVMEEDTDYSLADPNRPRKDSGGWAVNDAISNRHLRTATTKGYGCVGFADGHGGRIRLPSGPDKDPSVFVAKYHCIRTRGGKWVSGLSVPTGKGAYGWLDSAEPASSKLTH